MNNFEIDAVDLCARLTMHETMLTELMTALMLGIPNEDREAMAKTVCERMRYNMNFSHDDGDTSFQVQSKSVQYAEALFAKALSKAGSRA